MNSTGLDFETRHFLNKAHGLNMNFNQDDFYCHRNSNDNLLAIFRTDCLSIYSSFTY